MRSVLKYLVCGISLLLLYVQINAQQKETNIWYFGEYIGMDFNGGAPVALNDGQLKTDEGVASICDANGNLLFYTEGTKVWNRQHQLMPNGTALNGSYSSSQSGVIVPFINDPARYYVFTVDLQSGPKGLCYSVVNTALDGGKGDVEIKNVQMQFNVVEKITAIRHCNNRDVWVLVHGSASDTYYAYLVTGAGVNMTPVVSNSGTFLTGVIPPSTTDSTSLGCMKVSPDGKKIAAAHWTANVDISDFDNATGIVSNSFSLFTPAGPRYLSYGVEFSPDSRLLYVTGTYKDPNIFVDRNFLFQYDATLGTPAAVRSSKQVISEIDNTNQVYASLQVGPDKKMYMAKNMFKNISCINNPNIYGPGCGFIDNAIQWTLPNQRSKFGLPNFIQSYFYPLDSFTYVVNCPGLSVNFNYTIPANVNSIKWDFDDPASGATNTSTIANPTHVFSAAGIYNVELIKFTNCGTDTLRKQVATSGIFLDLGPDTLVCGGTNILLNPHATGSGITLVWNDGSTNPTLLATNAGLYWVEATSNLGCIFRDSINVNFKPKPVFNLGNDTTICLGDTLILNATVAGATSYLWSNGASTPSIKVSSNGLFWCEVNKDGCYFSDTINVNISARPIVDLGTDIAVCGTTPILLDASNPLCTYVWQDGSTNATFNVTISGLYWVEVKNSGGCTTRDSINIAFNTLPVFSLGADRSICERDTLILNATVPGAVNYLWNTGATTATIKAFAAGTYWCEVNNGCVYRDTIVITAVLPTPVVNLGADISVCGNSPVVLDATTTGVTYLWQDGSTNPTFNAINSGLYWVEVRNNGGCSTRDSINIVFTSIPVFNLGADTDICQGDTLTLNAGAAGATSYLWNTGATSSSIKAFLPGLYWCEATMQGCLFRDTLVISAIKPRPVVNLGADQTVCEDVVVTLDATYLNSGYTWQDGSTNALFNVTAAGVYSVELDLDGCKNSDTVRITHILKPRFTLGADAVVCPGSPLVLSPALNSSWTLLWNDGTTAPTHTVTEPGTFSLTATNNCGSTIDEVVISKGVCKVFLPSAFTPNKDGLNDVFRALGTETVTKFEMKIFNRWGEVVFQTNDKSRGWDGMVSGVQQSSAVFVYTVQYVDLNSPQPQTIKGTVALIR